MQDWEKIKFCPPSASNSLDYTRDLKKPRFIKTHLPWHLLPQMIQSGEVKPKIIFVARNPKDACISYWRHYRMFFCYKGSLEEHAEDFINDHGR